MESHPRQSLILTERQAATAWLPDADVEFLLVSHRPHLEIHPTRTRHEYRLRPRGFVGTILAPHTRLILRPKLPLANLCYLIDGSWPAELQEDQTELTSGSGLVDLLARRL